MCHGARIKRVVTLTVTEMMCSVLAASRILCRATWIPGNSGGNDYHLCAIVTLFLRVYADYCIEKRGEARE